jgi:hypothetical protein
MRFNPTITVETAQDLELLLPSLQRGQWINLDGAKGRVVGQAHSTWVAWGKAAKDRALFTRMCDAFANLNA